MITGIDSEYSQIADLKGTTMGISRPGRYAVVDGENCMCLFPQPFVFASGSQTMAHVMALQQGWSTKDLTFQGKSRRDDIDTPG